ncbi:hypothetical protein K7X08_027370 [Anisodus acutangulus]|uniref:Uncharacterized protein n=1 Tax=Anisodus acutangulus TaxID=402998 RepID=A0A9Q1RL01_9SOLA|nr:hypothetical protein K7X08_027370 [Anisodus acutangulus]
MGPTLNHSAPCSSISPVERREDLVKKIWAELGFDNHQPLTRLRRRRQKYLIRRLLFNLSSYPSIFDLRNNSVEFIFIRGVVSLAFIVDLDIN